MKEYFRRALFDALAELGEHNRDAVLYYLQKDYRIRFVVEYCPSVAEIELALRLTLGSASRIFIERFEMELQKYAIPINELR
jgi:hypothetical protein